MPVIVCFKSQCFDVNNEPGLRSNHYFVQSTAINIKLFQGMS